MGVKEQIRKATSRNAIARILGTAYNFENASAKTQRQWHRAAFAREKELSTQK